MKGIATIVLGLCLAFMVGLAVPHMSKYLPDENSIFANHDHSPSIQAPSPAVSPEVTPAVKVDWSKAFEIDAAEFERTHIHYPQLGDGPTKDKTTWWLWRWRHRHEREHYLLS